MILNNYTCEGKLKRFDIKEDKTKASKQPYISATATLVIGENEIKIEMFAMKLKYNGEESSGYTAIKTLYNESFAMYKSKKVGDKLTVEKKEDNDTIVESIEDCDVIRANTYGEYKYCRLEMNAFAKDGELTKDFRVSANFINRAKEDSEYNPNNEFECSGMVVSDIENGVTKSGLQCVSFTILVPIFNKEYTNKDGELVPSKVDLQELKMVCTEEDAFGFIREEFKEGNIVNINGEIFRRVARVEKKVVEENNDRRSFGKKIEHKTEYETKVEQYLSVLGGFAYDEGELDEFEEFDMNKWKIGKEVLDKKIEDLKNGGDKKPSGNKGFGRTENKKPSGVGKLPF